MTFKITKGTDETLSPKVAFNAKTLAILTEGAGETELALSVVFKTRAAAKKTDGVFIRSNIADVIYTADVSKQGLANLIADDNVTVIQDARPMRPICK